MPAIIRSYEWATHDHGISQNGRKTQQKGPVAHLTDGKKRQTHTISCHRTVIRKVHRLLGPVVLRCGDIVYDRPSLLLPSRRPPCSVTCLNDLCKRAPSRWWSALFSNVSWAPIG